MDRCWSEHRAYGQFLYQPLPAFRSSPESSSGSHSQTRVRSLSLLLRPRKKDNFDSCTPFPVVAVKQLPSSERGIQFRKIPAHGTAVASRNLPPGPVPPFHDHRCHRLIKRQKLGVNRPLGIGHHAGGASTIIVIDERAGVLGVG